MLDKLEINLNQVYIIQFISPKDYYYLEKIMIKIIFLKYLKLELVLIVLKDRSPKITIAKNRCQCVNIN